MQRKVLGAILLPLPFAALPVAAVLIGAVFGPGGNGEVVLRDTPAAIQDQVSTDSPTIDPAALASMPSAADFEPGCDENLLAGT